MTAVPSGWTPEQARKRLEAASGAWTPDFVEHAPTDVAALLALLDDARETAQFTRDFIRAVFPETDEPKALRLLEAFLARFAADKDNP